MLIGIIADTHVKKNTNKLVDALSHISQVDSLIHCGDYVSEEAYRLIAHYKKDFVGVYGNNDDEAIVNQLKKREIISWHNKKIGIVHGHGESKEKTIDRAYNAFKKDDVDVIIFGHSHQPIIKTYNGILMINPGSLTNKRREKYCSYAILELSKNNFNVIIKFIK